MAKLYLLALAAGAALVPASAVEAQQASGAGHTWRESAPVAVPPPPTVREVRQIRRGPVVQHGGGHRGRFGHIQRIGRGGMVPGSWWGPQFVIRDWHGYGFPQPFGGGRWIRYYDDALLIDRHGRVHDGRYGYDWSRHGRNWGEDRRGVPVYVGDGDFEPGRDDYEWAEDWERGDRDVIVRRDRRMPDDCGNPCTRTYHGAPPPPPHGGYGHAYGYGCGCGPVVVTETVTTTAPVMEQVTTYEYVTEYAPRARAAPKRRKPVRRAPAPAPRPGERG
jgi:Ni/Co efflux regulator RcnB